MFLVLFLFQQFTSPKDPLEIVSVNCSNLNPKLKTFLLDYSSIILQNPFKQNNDVIINLRFSYMNEVPLFGYLLVPPCNDNFITRRCLEINNSFFSKHSKTSHELISFNLITKLTCYVKGVISPWGPSWPTFSRYSWPPQYRRKQVFLFILI